jgi:hypothetical protein
MAQKPLVDPDFLIIEASLSCTVTPHSVGLLWTSDRPDAENYTWQHTRITTYRHPCTRRHSNLLSQATNGRRYKP